jgi:hypothetical protein
MRIIRFFCWRRVLMSNEEIMFFSYIESFIYSKSERCDGCNLNSKPRLLLTGGPGRSSGITTFSGNLEILSSNHGGGNLFTTTTHPSQLETSDVIWPRSIASDLRSPTQHLRSLRFFVSLATTTTTKLSPFIQPLPPLPAEPPLRPSYPGCWPLSP